MSVDTVAAPDDTSAARSTRRGSGRSGRTSDTSTNVPTSRLAAESKPITSTRPGRTSTTAGLAWSPVPESHTNSRAAPLHGDNGDRITAPTVPRRSVKCPDRSP
jgi:hypothetical protein